MDTSELALVFFTIMAQMSVGCFVVLGVIHLVGGVKLGSARVDRISDPALYAIGPVMVGGLLVSILHLGNPINALHSIENFQHSWLAREIVFGCAFAGLGAVFAFLQWRKWFPPLLRQLLAGLTALVGLALVTSSAMIYMLPTVPAWDSWATPVTFFTSAFLLGSVAIGAALVGVLRWQNRKGNEADEELATLIRKSLRGIAIASVVLLGVEFVVVPTYVLQLSQGGATAVASANALLYGHSVMWALRLGLVFLGAGVLGLLLYRLATVGKQRVLTYAAFGAFALVLASELIGRLLFYTAKITIGI
jgi:anaerobic dimethyl sulfoxide reductase subunit C (anchor subunit)